VARTFERQVVELHIRVALLNRFTQLGRPQTVPVAAVASVRLGLGLGSCRAKFDLCNKDAKPSKMGLVISTNSAIDLACTLQSPGHAISDPTGQNAAYSQLYCRLSGTPLHLPQARHHMTDHTPTYSLHKGAVPLLISIPHLGTELPPDLADGMSDTAAIKQDTDWHLDRLYGFAADMGASVLQAKVSRYVIDLNRPPSGESLYPGQTTTGLCPTETFRGEPLYRQAQALSASQQADRLARYWQPYHDALCSELDRLKEQHGTVLLWDAHSIASVLPRLFDGELPNLNFGTADGRSCAPSIIETVVAEARASRFSYVVNGRFKGGYITRQYGVPANRVHAIQLEMGQDLYMLEEPPFNYLESKATSIKPLLRKMLMKALTSLTST